MTLSKDVAEAIKMLISHCPSDLQTYVETIRAHLLSQDAEIAAMRAQLIGPGHVPYLDRMRELVERAERAESRLAAADALLRKILANGYFEADIHEYLQGAGDEA